MTKKDDRSPLAAAVDALEFELLQLSRHTEQALKVPLNSEKHLQQVASSLGAIGAMEGSLNSSMGRLMSALTELGQRQQSQMDQASARADELKQRHLVFQELMKSYAALGASAQDLLGLLGSFGNVTDQDAPASVADALTGITDKLAGLVAEAEGLEAQAAEKDFLDLVKHARSLRQQLASAHITMMRRLEKIELPKSTTPPNGASNGHGQ